MNFITKLTGPARTPLLHPYPAVVLSFICTFVSLPKLQPAKDTTKTNARTPLQAFLTSYLLLQEVLLPLYHVANNRLLRVRWHSLAENVTSMLTVLIGSAFGSVIVNSLMCTVIKEFVRHTHSNLDLFGVATCLGCLSSTGTTGGIQYLRCYRYCLPRSPS